MVYRIYELKAIIQAIKVSPSLWDLFHLSQCQLWWSHSRRRPTPQCWRRSSCLRRSRPPAARWCSWSQPPSQLCGFGSHPSDELKPEVWYWFHNLFRILWAYTCTPRVFLFHAPPRSPKTFQEIIFFPTEGMARARWLVGYLSLAQLCFSLTTFCRSLSLKNFLKVLQLLLLFLAILFCLCHLDWQAGNEC